MATRAARPRLGLDEVLAELDRLGDPRAEALTAMARFGIDVSSSRAVRVPDLRRLGRRIGTDHELALALWEEGSREGRILATLAADPALLTEAQLERWFEGLTDWERCDQLAGNLLWRLDAPIERARGWLERDEQWVRRAAFATLAALALKRSGVPDAEIEACIPLIERHVELVGLPAAPQLARPGGDEHDYVRKGASWALRQIGKRSAALHAPALAAAERLAASPSRGARWVGRDAERELRSAPVLARLGLDNRA